MNGIGGGMDNRFITQEQLEEHQKEQGIQLNEFNRKLKSTEQDLRDQFNSLKEQMKQKISMQNLYDAEERSQELIDRVVGNINKRFMDK